MIGQETGSPSMVFWPEIEEAGGLGPETNQSRIRESFLSWEDRQRIYHASIDAIAKPNFTFGNPERSEEFKRIFLPFSTLDGWIYENEEIAKAYDAFNVNRLSGIGSLSLVRYVGSDPEMAQYYDYKFVQTREYHTLVVARVVEAIMRNNGFSEKEIRIGIAAAMLHDIATPALGDATKSLDSTNLDEENHWWTMLDKKGWKYLEKIGATQEMIDHIIHNRGVVGEILDIADRITYTMIDIHSIKSGATLYDQDKGYVRDRLDDILEEDPDIGDIFQEVEVNKETGDVYFTNPNRAGIFLAARAFMFENMYVHPLTQGRDMLLAKTLERFYSPREGEAPLSPKKLRTATDDGLLYFLQENLSYDRSHELYLDLYGWTPQHYEKFDSSEEANKRAQELKNNSDCVVVGVCEIKEFNPATDHKVLGEWGRIYQFRDYYPEKAAQIEEAAERTKGFFVYYDDSKDVNPLVARLSA